MTKKPNMALFIKLQTPDGEEYIIDCNEEVFGPSFITRQRILYHMWLAYRIHSKHECDGDIMQGYLNQFINTDWIKVVDSKIITEEEERQAREGEIVY